MIMYGPPGSGFRSVSGVFVEGAYSRRDFTPPSSVMHRRSLTDRIGLWRSPDVTELPVDCDYFTAVADSGARIVSTDELTVFKFNAAWRRDSYKLKDTAEQKSLLARIEGGRDFRQEELFEVVRAAAADRFFACELPKPAPIGSYHRQNRRTKGADKWHADEEMQSLAATRRFGIENGSAFEWHGEEAHPTFGSFRWSGPLARASIFLPVYFDRHLFFRMHVISAIDQALLTSLKIFVQGSEMLFESETTPNRSYMLTWSLAPPAGAGPQEPLTVTIDTGRTRRPRDVGFNEDRRWLGLAVNWIEIGPVSAVPDRRRAGFLRKWRHA
jgi:hypothetical protein